MAKKYYAVRKGRIPGIYLTWNDCKAQTDGFSGAEYKSFMTRDQAVAYVEGEAAVEIETKTQNGIPVTDEKNAVAYVDGSYNNVTKEFSYGVVMFHNGEEKHFSEKVDDIKMAEMRNVAGEIKGAEALYILNAACTGQICAGTIHSTSAMRAPDKLVDYAMENNCETLVIYHDYEGIAKWCTGAWKANKEGTIAYKEYYDQINSSLAIEFRKVKGHSGDRYNDVADRLAKSAIF